jgi:hypothetical protein
MASKPPKIAGNPIPSAAPGPGAGPGTPPGQPPNGPGPGSQPGIPGASPPPAADDDTPWRLDDHQRRLESIEKATHPEHVAGLVHGAVAAVHASLQQEIQKLLEATRKDIQADTDVVSAIRELIEELKQHRLATRQV